MNATRWFCKAFGRNQGSPARRASRRPRTTRLYAEFLEDRLAPAGSSINLLQSNATINLKDLGAATPDTATQVRISNDYGQLPLEFEANQGQTDPQVQFLARGSGYALFLTASGAVLSLRQGSGVTGQASADKTWGELGAGVQAPPAPPASVTGVALAMNLIGANPRALVAGQDQLPGTSNYFIGNDPSQWHTNIANYGQVAFQDVYPGVNLVYYGNQQQLEYDFMVAPGANPDGIRFVIQGADGMRLDEQGNLVLSTEAGDVLQHAPVIYQQVGGGARQAVAGKFVLLGQDEVGFQVGTYDASLPLTIDPVLSYSTYLGDYDDIANSIAVDSSGNAYVTGGTYSFNFPTTAGAYQTQMTGREDAFVTKLNAAGTTLVYSTFLGGSAINFGNGIALDGSGSAYVTGGTNATDFPTTTGAFQRNLGGGGNGFVTKLNATGTALLYSTYLGRASSSGEIGTGIAVDSSAYAYVTGQTYSGNFPTTTGAFQTTFRGTEDAFVTKLNAAGTALVYSTFLGGSAINFGNGIALDGSGNAYVTGGTNATDFPTTTGAFQRTLGGGGNGFVTKLNATGTALLYSTYLGGTSSSGEIGAAIAVDGSGYAYVTGATFSSNFPTTAGAFQTQLAGTENAFVTKLNKTGTALGYSTFLGGSGEDYGQAIAVDGSGNAYVTGGTSSNNFPTTIGSFQNGYGGSGDAFMTGLNATGTALFDSTYLGGGSGDGGDGIAVDSFGNAYVAGYTQSTNFPTAVSAYQSGLSGTENGFVVKLTFVTFASTPSLANWTVNQPGYSETISASGGIGSLTFSETGPLPAGLTLSSVGVLFGTPTVTGTYSFTVTAIDPASGTGSQSFTVTINPAVSVTTTSLADGTVNQPVYYQVISARGGTGPLTFTAPAATLPPGLTLISAGVLAGTPTKAGNYTLTVTVADAVGASASEGYTLVISPVVAITTTMLPNWTVSQPGYSQTITTSGGTGPLTFSMTGTLPAGLTLGSSGVLSGSPSATGTYLFTVTASDTVGASGSQSYTITINPAPVITTSTLVNWTMSQPGYVQTINASGGTGTLTFSTTGTLPPGLMLSNAGLLAGSPSAMGTYDFTVMATDAVGASATQSYSVTINPGLAITTTSLADWTLNLAGYSQSIGISGGTMPFAFTTTSGTLPPGLMLSSGGILSGTPTATGSYTFRVTATDFASATSSQTYTVTISPAVMVTTDTLGNWTVSQPGYLQTIGAAGGTGTLTFSATGSLPSGLTLSSSGVLSGMPTAAGTYSFVVTATDAVGGTASQSYTVVINPAVTLTPGVMPPGLINIAYNQTITALGGTGTVTLAVSNLAGAIPGLNVPSGGTGTLVITGTPTATGTATFTVTATDTLGVSTSSSYSITINPSTVYLNLPTSGFTGMPGGMVARFPININQLEDQASTNHVGLASDTLAVSFPTGVFTFPLGSGNASADVSLGSVPLSDSVSPGGAADWNLSATSPGDGQLNITLAAKSGKSITSDNPATGGSLVTINFPISATYNPASSTVVPITVITANGSFHTAVIGSNGAYVLKPTPPYAGSLTINSPGPGTFSQYLVSVLGSDTVQAGSGMLVAVQAADAVGSPVTSYSGPGTVTASMSPASAGNNVPATVSLNGSGLGYFLASAQKAGSYTIAVAGGLYSGSSNPVTVTPGPAVKLAFAATPAATPTGDVLPAVLVQVEDLYGNVVTGDNSDTVTIGVANGSGSFTSGSTLTATVHSGVATFHNLALVAPGTYQLSAIVPGLYTGPNSAPFSVFPLQAVPGSFAGTPSGFSLQFNTSFLVNSVTPALYGIGSGAGATVTPTVSLTQLSGTPPAGAVLPYQVPGSLIVNAATNTLTFVETDTASVVGNDTPLLLDGVYMVHISSGGPNGLQALNPGGGYLDGTNSGTPGHDFTATFTVGTAAAGEDALWVPATADGPGQPLSAPGLNQAGGGYPVYLDDHTGTVTDIQATLTYDPALLTVTPTSTATFSVTVPSAGTAVLHYSGPALTAGVQTPIGYITATVPAGTTANPVPYRGKDLLTLSGVSLNGGAIAALGANAVHLVSYVGDATGEGTYSSDDAVRITRVLLQSDTGFAAYPLVDPVIVADIDGSGFIPADAALQANEAGVGVPAPNLPIPPIPGGVHFQAVTARPQLTPRIVTEVFSGAAQTTRSTQAMRQELADAQALLDAALDDPWLGVTVVTNPSETAMERRRLRSAWID